MLFGNSGLHSTSLHLHLALCVSVQESATQDIAESLVEDFVVTESAEAVEVAIAESAVQPVREE